MKVVIPGGSGQVGTMLARAFQRDGHEVTVLSRRAHAAQWRVLGWDGRNDGPWSAALESADAVINLAGRSVNCRYTPKNQREIFDSRMQSTRAIGKAIAGALNPPRVWLQASTATIYSHRYDAPNDDVTGILGGSEPTAPDTWRFSIDVAHAWEAAADEIALPHTRVVKLRSAMVMSPDRGGIFDTLLGLVRRGLGGKSGDGKQYVSWVHDTDFIAAILHLIGRDNIRGAVNIASPQPLPNAEFMEDLRKAWGIRIGLPATKLMLEIGARFLRTETELILKSRRVVPKRLVDSGFAFTFPEWYPAASDLCSRWKFAQKKSSRDHPDLIRSNGPD